MHYSHPHQLAIHIVVDGQLTKDARDVHFTHWCSFSEPPSSYPAYPYRQLRKREGRNSKTLDSWGGCELHQSQIIYVCPCCAISTQKNPLHTKV